MMEKKIVVVGSANTDMILKLPRIPRPGETIIGGEFFVAAGGKGANQAVSAARAGAKVVLVARVGSDIFGVQSIDGFIKDGIDVRHIARDDHARSGVALIFVGQDGENSIGVASGANAHLSVADVGKARKVISRADILLLQLETPIKTLKAAARIAADNGVRVILNPAPAQPLDDEFLRSVSILTPNESEAEILTGIRIASEKSMKQAAEQLLARGIETVMITLGPRGVYVSSAKGNALVPGFPIEPLDTTAAGDVFNGALAVSLAENHDLLVAARFACAAAALSCCKLGAQTSVPYRREIDSFLVDRT
jgi:ribokinase